MQTNFKCSCFALSGLLFVFASICESAETGPRSYVNAPVGLNVFRIISVHSELEGTSDVTTNATALYYYKYVDFFGKIALIGGSLPYVNAAVSVPTLRLKLTAEGMGDPTFVIGMDFIGAPALEMKEFKSYQQGTIIGGSLQITMPLGAYDSSFQVNTGANRWVFQPEIALAKRFGDFAFELYGNYQIYTDNKDYSLGLRKEQNPILGFDLHISYDLTRSTWFSLDFIHRQGGETTIDSVRQQNSIDDDVVGATLKYPLPSGFSFQGKYKQSLKLANADNSKSYRLQLQYVW